MRVIHTISSLGLNSGGPSRSVYSLVGGLVGAGIDAGILTYADPGAGRIIAEDDFIRAIDYLHPKPFAYNRAYGRVLRGMEADIYHAHAIFEYPTYITARVARHVGKPYIIAPRGSLYRQAIDDRSRLVKRLFIRFSLMEDMNRAAAVHATAVSELEALRELGVRSPIAVIPNGLELPERSITGEPQRLRVGYLGRISPKKNIETLLYAWARLGLDGMDAELVIIGDAGDKEREYKRFLLDEQRRLGLRSVVWMGNLFGDEKAAVMSTISYLVVPSHTENFGMVVAEALLHGIPVIASRGTPWEELTTHGCGWWVESSVEGISRALSQALGMSAEERRAMGLRGERLIRERYSQAGVTAMAVGLYEWILGCGSRPDFVYER